MRRIRKGGPTSRHSQPHRAAVAHVERWAAVRDAMGGWLGFPITMDPMPPNQTLEPTATARLARGRLGFEFDSVAFELALPVAVAQLFR